MRLAAKTEQSGRHPHPFSMLLLELNQSHVRQSCPEQVSRAMSPLLNGTLALVNLGSTER